MQIRVTLKKSEDYPDILIDWIRAFLV